MNIPQKEPPAAFNGDTPERLDSPAASFYPFSAEQVDLRDYLRVIVGRRWAILTVLLVVVLVTGIVTLTATPLYRATTQILIEQEAPKILNIEDILPTDTTAREFYQTQYKILQSRTLAKRIIDKLELSENPDFNPPPSGLFAGEKTEADPNELNQRLIDRFLGNLHIKPIRDSRLVDITFESPNPELAARVANAVATAYIDMNLEMKFGATRQAVEWLNRQIEEQKTRLEESEQALQRYRVESGLISEEDKKSIASERLTQLNSDLVASESRRIGAEERYKHVKSLTEKGTPIDSIPEIADNKLVQELKSQEVKLITEISDLSQRYGEKHPKIVRARAELEILHRNLDEIGKNLVENLKNEYLVTKQQEERLREVLAEQAQELQTLMEKSIRFRVLKREVETNKQLYETLLKRLKEATVSEDIRATNVRVVDKASIPLSPAKPKKRQNILLAFIVGLMGGVGLAFFLEYMDDTFKVPEDLERHLGAANLALLPATKIAPEELGDDRIEWIVKAQPRSAVSEGFRSLRANLLFSSAGRPPQLIMVTSAVPGEGKTFTAANLAVALAQLNKRVLLVDADMRKPRLHRVFNLEKDQGLSNILVGAGRPQPQSTSTTGLDVLPCGPIPPNPAELLSSDAMETFLKKQREQYDFVVIDSPPAGTVSDPMVLGRFIDGTVVVVQSGKTPRPQVANVVNALAEVGIHVLGTVLNMVEVSRDRYYYSRYYHYYYNGYYGDEKEREG